MSAYRSPEAGASETILIPVERSTWWTLVFVLPLPLVLNRAFMNLVVPLPSYNPSGYDAVPPIEELHHASSIRDLIMIGAGFVAFAGVFIALTSLARTKNVVVIDRGARVVRVRTKKGAWDVAFGERPTLVERDGEHYLHAGAFAPVLIATHASPRASIDRLRAALQAL